MLMLTVFAANFLVVCHCSARAERHTCCVKKEQKAPCKDDGGCTGTHAVKFNLTEKQASSKIQIDPLYAVMHAPQPVLIVSPAEEIFYPCPRKRPARYSPPDLLSLYQCFLI
jgi:hypothetical protein